MQRLYAYSLFVVRLKRERKSYIIVCNNVFSPTIEAKIAVNDINSRHAKTELGTINFDAYGTTRVHSYDFTY